MSGLGQGTRRASRIKHALTSQRTACSTLLGQRLLNRRAYSNRSLRPNLRNTQKKGRCFLQAFSGGEDDQSQETLGQRKSSPRHVTCIAAHDACCSLTGVDIILHMLPCLWQCIGGAFPAPGGWPCDASSCNTADVPIPVSSGIPVLDCLCITGCHQDDFKAHLSTSGSS